MTYNSYIFTPTLFKDLLVELLPELQYLLYVFRIKTHICDLDTFIDSVQLEAFGSEPMEEDYCYCYIVALFDGNIHIFFAHCRPGMKCFLQQVPGCQCSPTPGW